MSKRISLGSWAVTIGPYQAKPVSFDDVCQKLKELGFDDVEIGGFRPHPNPDDIPDRQARRDLAARIREQYGLGFSGLAANLWGQKLINTDDTKPYIAEFKKNAEFANHLGIEVIRVDCVQPPTIFTKFNYREARERVVNTWKECCKIAAAYGQKVTWEFEPGWAFNSPSDIARICSAVDMSIFGVLYDLCHGQTTGVVGARQVYNDGRYKPECERQTFSDQVAFIDYLIKEGVTINHIHIIDSDGGLHNNETSNHIPFGKGVVNFDKVMPALAKASKLVRDSWTIDLCFCKNAWEVTKQCKQFADRLNRQYGNIQYVGK